MSFHPGNTKKPTKRVHFHPLVQVHPAPTYDRTPILPPITIQDLQEIHILKATIRKRCLFQQRQLASQRNKPIAPPPPKQTRNTKEEKEDRIVTVMNQCFDYYRGGIFGCRIGMNGNGGLVF